MPYSIQLPDGRIVADIPDEVTPQEAKARLLQAMPELAQYEQKPIPTNTNGWVDDTWASAKSSALGAAGAIAGGFGADNPVARKLDTMAAAAANDVSPARAAEVQAQAQRRKAAEATGDWTEEVKAAGQNFIESPVQALAGAAGSMVPTAAVTALASALGLGAAAVTAIMGVVGMVQGGGTAKNSIYEAVRDAELADGKPPAEAESKAVAAQEYFGANMGNIAASSVIGGVANATGAERLLPGSSRVAGGVEKALARKVGERTAQSLIAGATEIPTEALQGGHERYASNVALQRTGRDVPTFQGVAGQSTEEGLAGGIGGVGLGAVRSPKPSSGGVSEKDREAQIAAVAAELDAIAARDAADAEKVAQAEADKNKRPEEPKRLPAPELAPEPAAQESAAPVPEPTLRKKPEPVQPAGVTLEELGPTAYRYARGKQGQAFITKLQALSPEQASMFRTELVGKNANKDAIFTALFGEGQTSASYVEPAPAPTPVAESSLPEPTMTVEPTVEERVAELEKARTELLTKAGKPPAVRSPARRQYDNITAQLEALAPAPVAPAPVAPAPVAPAPVVESTPVTPPVQAADAAVEGAGDTRPTQEAPVEIATEPEPTPAALDAVVSGLTTEPEPVVLPDTGAVTKVREKKSLRTSDKELIDSAVAAYDAPARDESVYARSQQENSMLSAVQYLDNTAQDPDEHPATRAYAQKMLDENVDPKDLARARASRPLLKAAQDAGRPKVDGLDDAVSNGDTREALAAIRDSENSSDFNKVLAERLMKFKSLPRIRKVDDLKESGQYDAQADEVRLKDVGIHTTMHEVVHGFLHRLIADHEAGLVKSPAIDNLRQLYDYVAKKHPAWRTEYGFKNLSEFASEAMSNDKFQAALNSVPYQQTNAFTAFVRRVLQALGIKPTSEHTAFMESVVQVDAALEQGREYQTARTGTKVAGKLETIAEQREPGEADANIAELVTQTEKDIAKASDMMAPEKSTIAKVLRKMADGFDKADNLSFGTRFRALVVDSMAPVSAQLNTLFDGAVRAGVLKNPEVLLRQGVDSGKLLKPFAEFGVLDTDPLTGLWEAKEPPAGAPRVPTIIGLKKDIRDWGARNGLTPAEADALFSKRAEALRLRELDRLNRTTGTDFAINKLANRHFMGKMAQVNLMASAADADPEFQSLKADMDAIRGSLIDKMVAVGRLTAAEGVEWKRSADYVPFKRIANENFNNSFKVQRALGRGVSALGKLPELQGSDALEVGDVMDNFVELSGWMIQQVVRQDATQTTLRMLQAMGHATRVGASPPSDRATGVMSYVNGVPTWYKLPTRWHVEAFREMAPPKGAWVRLFETPAQWLRTAITAMPPFAAMQVAQDIQRAFVTSGVRSPYQLVFPILRNFVSIAWTEGALGKQHAITKQFERFGLTGEYDFNSRNPAESLWADYGYQPRTKRAALLHRLDSVTRASDVAVRAAIYNQTVKETGDTMLASARAREFINFRRRGSANLLGPVIATVPFFNAYLQGMDVLYRAATGSGASAGLRKQEAQRQFMAKVSTLAGFAALYAFMSGDDDEYEKPLDERGAQSRINRNAQFGNWILPGGARVPVPSELGVLFKVIPELTFEYMRRQGTSEEVEAMELVKTAVQYGAEQYFGRVVPIPAAIKPVLEAFTNHSFLTGRELEGTYMKQLNPQDRMRATTSELAVAISKFGADTFGEANTMSPIVVDNFIRGYFGTMAATFTMATDQLFNPNRLDRPMHKAFLLGSFMYGDDQMTREKDELYALREKVAKTAGSLKELESKSPVEVEGYVRRNAESLALYQRITPMLQNLSYIRAERKYLQSDKGAMEAPKDYREKRLKELLKEEANIVDPLREIQVQTRKELNP